MTATHETATPPAVAAPAHGPAASAAPANPNVPRAAFTDDRDALVEYTQPPPHFMQIAGPTSGLVGPHTPGYADPTTVHEGEASTDAAGYTVFVSTRDKPNGDVYLANPGSPVPRRITCDDAIETHPVRSGDGQIAFASNADGPSNPGHFNIWVVPTGPGGGKFTAPVTGCETEAVELPNQRGDNFWPTWLDDGTLAYSSTRDNPLGDIYAQATGSATTAVRLTDGGGTVANTQPFLARPPGGPDGDPLVLLLTTTQFRSDGSIGEITGTSPGDTALPRPVHSAWDTSAPPQSSEPASMTQLIGIGPDPAETLAFTSTETNPLGSVIVANQAAGSAAVPFVFAPGSMADIENGGNPSAPASHPAWDDGSLLVTTRQVAADIADAQSDDGSDRRTIAQATDDPPVEGGTPAYSPDGTQIAYSSRVGADADGRRLVITDADGTKPHPVPDGWTRDAAPRTAGITAYDIQPAWSPDGTKLAFVRAAYRYSEADRLVQVSRTVWIADLTKNTAAQMTPAGKSDSVYYAHPSWSPDGKRIVVSRSGVPADLAVQITAPSELDVGDHGTVEATVRNLGTGPAQDSVLTVTAPDGFALTPTAACPGDAATVTCALGKFAAGAGVVIDVDAVATAGLDDAPVEASVTTSSNDYDPDNDTATARVSTQPADVKVSGTLSPTDLYSGTATLTLTVTNNGPGRAHLPTVSVSTHSSLVAMTVQSGCTPTAGSTGQSLDCAMPDLATNRARQIVITLTQTACTNSTPATTTISVFASSSTTDPNLLDNFAERDVSLSVCIHWRETVGAGPGRAPVRLPLTAVPDPVLPGGGYVRDPVRELTGDPPIVETPEIWILDAKTGAGAPLRGCAGEGCAVQGRSPSWSPDGKRIAYDDGGQLNLATLDAPAATSDLASVITAVTGFSAYTSGTGGPPTPSRRAISAAHDPTWAPGGSEIYFTGQPAGQPDNAGIFAIKPDGNRLRAVAQRIEPESEPTVQPVHDVSVTLAAVPAAIPLAGSTTLAATIIDTGDLSFPDATLTIQLPPGLAVTPASLPSGCTIAGPATTCAVGTVVPGTPVTINLAATGSTPGTKTVTAAVHPPRPDRNPANDTATTTVIVGVATADLAVSVHLSQPVGYVGGKVTATITVTNHGPLPATAALQMNYTSLLTVTASPACLTGTAACMLGVLAPRAHRTFVVTLTPKPRGAPRHGYGAAITAHVSSTVADPKPANDVARAALPVKQPVLRLLPPIGAPGFVTLAYGQNLPPGSRVTLIWRTGITSYAGPYTVDSDGTLQAPVLVVRRDELGVRHLIAKSTTARFTSVQAAMLVVARTESPPRLLGRG